MSHIAVINILMILSKHYKSHFFPHIYTLAQIIDENSLKSLIFSSYTLFVYHLLHLRAPMGMVVVCWNQWLESLQCSQELRRSKLITLWDHCVILPYLTKTEFKYQSLYFPYKYINSTDFKNDQQRTVILLCHRVAAECTDINMVTS